MEILGLPFSERALLTIAQVYERLRGPRVLPKTTPHLLGDIVKMLTVQDFNGLRFVPDTKCSRSPATASLLTRLVQ